MQTKSFNSDTVDRAWHVVDLDGVVLGRAASRIALVLRGKHKPTFTTNGDVGDFVVVINAGKVRLTGAKWKDKTYYSHTGYFGGLKSITAEKLRDKDPRALISKAVWGMLPKGSLGRRMFKKLKVYAEGEHPHSAQDPQPLDLSKVGRE
jgi:large subunit ribosomal protein L13